MKKADLVWEESSPWPRHSYNWKEIAEECKKRPGEWLVLFEWDRTSLVTAIRLNGIKALPWSDFDVATRYNTRGTPRMCKAWIRYRG